MSQRAAVAVAALLTLPTLGAGGVAGTTAGSVGTASPDAPASGVTVTATYDLSAGDASEVGVRLAFSLAEDVAELHYRPPQDATVVSTEGFERISADRLAWDGETTDPSIEMRRRPRFAATRIGLFFAIATEDWALLRTSPGTSVRTAEGWHGSESPLVSRQVRTAGEGFVGTRVVYLGPHEVRERRVDGTAIRLVVPEGGMTADPDRVLDRLAFAVRHLDVGGAGRDVTIVVGPEPIYHGYVAGSNASAIDLVISASEPASAPDDTWLHEYVHARQNWSLAGDVRWFTEGSANYYAALTHLHRTGNYEAFRLRVTTAEDRDAVLADAAPNHTRARYTKGMRVAAALDAEIRAASGGTATLADVLSRMNAHEGRVGHDEFARFVSEAAGTDMRSWVDRYVFTSAVPAVPDEPARFAATDPGVDSEGDGLPDVAEVERGTNPFATDTDEDGLPDAAELDHGTDPVVPDTDGDDLPDGREVERGTDPVVADTDRDGLVDGREVELGADPLVADTDGDGLEDTREATLATAPDDPDTDGDGLDDAAELDADTDPLTTDSDGDGVADGDDVAPTDPDRTTPAAGPGFGGLGALAALAALAVWLGGLRRRDA